MEQELAEIKLSEAANLMEKAIAESRQALQIVTQYGKGKMAKIAIAQINGFLNRCADTTSLLRVENKEKNNG